MSKVTRKYQITIPLNVRKTLGINPGSEVAIVRKGGNYVLKANSIEDLKRAWNGKFKNEKSSDEYMAEIRGDIW